MSTLEKLLVLGVLILVGVILAISLFWNRPDAGGQGLDMGSVPNANGTSSPNNWANPNADLPIQSTLTTGVNGSGVNGMGSASKPADLGASLSSVQPVDGAGSAPYPFLQTSLSPEYWAYRVRQGDTPMIVSERVSGSREFARVISRSNEDRPLVPGTSILIPREIVKPPSSIQTGVPSDALAAGPTGTDPIPTGPKETAGPVKPVTADPNPTKSSTGVNLTKPNATASPTAALYVVKRGDSLRKIAREQLKSEKRWKEIQAVNNMKTDVVREGQKLLLP